MRTLWQHCHVATMAEGRYSAIEDAAIVTSAGLIEWIGPRAELAPVEADRTVDLGGAMPATVTCPPQIIPRLSWPSAVKA